jgi:photosystem II stability/assembly factor-like uncharacterized protein
MCLIADADTAIIRLIAAQCIGVIEMSRHAIFAVAISILISVIWFDVSGAATPPAAQTTGWVRQNPAYENTLYAVDFADANVGLAVGSGGLILQTTDGGATWAQRASGTTVTLHDVAFFDAMRALAIGEGGTILKTENGGLTWSSRTSGVTGWLLSVSILDENIAMIPANHTFLRTTDGGDTWHNRGIVERCLADYVNRASFADTNTAMAIGDMIDIYRSLDGGNTWKCRSAGYGAPDHFNDIVCFDSSTAIVAGCTFSAYGPSNDLGTIGRTTDGGASWSIGGYNSYGDLNGLSFVDTNTGAAVGDNGAILRTTNGGISWAGQSSGTNSNLYGVCFTDASTGTAVGAGGTILRTTNGGATWAKQTNAVTLVILTAVHFLDANTGVAVGDRGTLLRTTNGGIAWAQLHYSPSEIYSDIAFNGGSTGLMLDTYYTPVGIYYYVYRTVDGGATWVSTRGGQNSYDGCCFADATTAYVIGEEALKSTDGGATWAAMAVPAGYFNGVFFSDAFTGTIIGKNSIFRTTDGGITWTPQSSGTSNDLFDLCFTDANTGTIVGAGGTILRTTNGGATWTPQTSGTSMTLYSVCFTNANTGTVVGRSGTVLRTTDGGATWMPQASGTTKLLMDVHFTDAQTGTIVGEGGTILRTVSGGEPVAVLLQRWAAAWAGDHVLVTWELMREALASEPAFEISRSADRGMSFMPIAAPDISLDGKEYSLRDYTAEPGARYIYRVVIRENAESIASFEVEVGVPAPSLTLAQNHPNPFNPTTTIGFTLPAESAVTIDIYDSAGRFVRRVLEARVPAGQHEASWDGRNAAGTEVASGVYFCRLAAGKESLSRKIVLLR